MRAKNEVALAMDQFVTHLDKTYLPKKLQKTRKLLYQMLYRILQAMST